MFFSVQSLTYPSFISFTRGTLYFQPVLSERTKCAARESGFLSPRSDSVLEFGTKRSQVQILSPRPDFKADSKESAFSFCLNTTENGAERATLTRLGGRIGGNRGTHGCNLGADVCGVCPFFVHYSVLSSARSSPARSSKP